MEKPKKQNKSPAKTTRAVATKQSKATKTTTTKRKKAVSKKTTKTDEVQAYAEKITAHLRELGAYSPSFGFLIDSCAQLIYARNKAFDVLRGEDLILREVSREGELRLKNHPICSMYIELSKELRQVLGELTMTAKTNSVVEGDELDQLNMKIMNMLSGAD